MGGVLRRLIDRVRPGRAPAKGAGPGISAGGPARDLTGDRELEWTYVSARIGRYADRTSRVLDFGCGDGHLTFAAGSLGASVLAVDLGEPSFPVVYPTVAFRKADVMSLDEDEGFDLVICCSTIEHVGLAGRYGVVAENPDGDLLAMGKLRRMLKHGGHMLLTVPVGLDAVIKPLHRIYGPERLPRLLEGFRVVESLYFLKDGRNRWVPCSGSAAMAEPGGAGYYALGLMVLAPGETDP